MSATTTWSPPDGAPVGGDHGCSTHVIAPADSDRVCSPSRAVLVGSDRADPARDGATVAAWATRARVMNRWSALVRWSRLARWLTPVGVALIALAGCVTLAIMDPVRRGELSPGCPFRTLTGWDCPGCGATRAAYALTQGQFLRAIDHNVLVVAFLPLLAWAWFGWLSHTLGRRPAPPTLPPRVSMGLATVITVFWVGRNLPGLEWLGSMATWSLGA